MKRRITFIVPKDAPPVVPENFEYDGKSLKINDIVAVRQDRAIFELKNLPSQLQEILKRFTTLHIRWVAPTKHKIVEPFVSHAPPGVHVFAKRKLEDPQSEHLCDTLGPELSKLLDCRASGDPIVLPNGFEQLYNPLSDPTAFLDSLKTAILCGTLPEEQQQYCIEKAENLHTASSFDLDYRDFAEELRYTVLWDRNRKSPKQLWNVKLDTMGEGTRVEVGILDQRPALDEHEIQLGGVTSVLGKSTELKPVQFFFASRHHSANADYQVKFQQPTGLHPKLELQLNGTALAKPPAEDCTLNAYFTLPKFLFIDKYQLSDPQFLESIGLKRLVGVYGETDLEAPTWTQKPWGSSFLIELSGGDVKKSILPLHTRYLPPVEGENQNILHEVPWPVIFYACPSEYSGSKLEINPFDRTSLGFEHYFGKQTVYYHLKADGERFFTPIAMPTIGLKHAELIKMGTIGVVLSGFLYLVFMIFSSFKKGSVKDERKKKE